MFARMNATSFLLEQRSLSVGKWANLFMALAGVVAAMLANASALLLDGLFSGVNFFAILFAAQVALRVQRKPDALRPFGYEIDESLYLLFRSLVLLGILAFALINAVAKIVTWAAGGELPEVRLGWVTGYVILMMAICFGLAAWHHRHWVKGGRRSPILAAERTSSVVDGLISAATGVAFLGIALLKDTPLGFLVPISDSVVVLLLGVGILPQPLRMFRKAFGEVAGESVESPLVEKCRDAVRAAMEGGPFQFLETAAARMGRTLFVLVWVKPAVSVDAAQVDALCRAVQTACDALADSVRSDVILSPAHPHKPELEG